MKKIKEKTNKFIPKNYNTKVSTIKEKYSIHTGSSENQKLGDYLKKEGFASLAEMLKI